jgi:hypothetical protein
MDAKLIAQVKADQAQLQSDLSFLTDRIGPAPHWLT